jgi:hypothetical protein
MQQRPNIFFRLALATGAVFVVTVLALTAAIFSDHRAPMARLLDDYGGEIIAVEVAATLIFAFWAMALDRRRQLRADRLKDFEEPKEGSS